MYSLIFLLIAAYSGYAQSIQNVYPSEGRRNEQVWFTIEGLNTHFTSSSILTVSLKSATDGSVITLEDVYAGGDEYCDGMVHIPATATPGKYAVRVVTSNEGTLTKANAFTISNLPPIPELISITPATANNGEHVRLTIKARYAKFLTASNIEVQVGGQTTHLAADSVVALNDSTLSATIDIPVKNRSDMCYLSVYTDIDNVYLPDCFTINGIDPEIVLITPDSAGDGEHVDVTIRTTKTSFTNSATPDVMLQGTWTYLSATTVTTVNDTVLVASFDIPKHERANVCDVVIFDDGDGIRQMGAFMINGIYPVITSVSPVEGEQGETLDVTITGEDMFFSAASGINVNFWGSSAGFIQGSSVVVLNENQIKTTLKISRGTPAGSYALDLNIDGEGFYAYDVFTVLEDGIPDPRLVSVSPSEVSRGQVLDVTITGERTQFTQSSNIQVYLSGNGWFEPLSTVIVSDTKLKCSFFFPLDAPLGAYTVYVYDGISQQLELWDGLTIIGNPNSDPILVSVTPAMTFPGQTLDVTITGVRTHFMASSATYSLYIFSQATDLMATSFTATSNTTMNARFEIPTDFPLGVYDLGIGSSIDGWITLLQSVIVNAVGLGEEEKLSIQLYPNPVKDKLYLKTETEVNTITILDITGRQIPIDKNEIEHQANLYTIPLDRIGLKKGIYFIRLTSDSGSGYQKFVVD